MGRDDERARGLFLQLYFVGKMAFRGLAYSKKLFLF